VAISEQGYVSLKDSKDGGDLIRSHQQVSEYYTAYNNARETHFDFLAGKQWNADEQAILTNKKKTAIVFNQIKSSERTVLGLFIQNRYDIKFAPREPSDQEVSDVLQQLYSYLEGQQEWAYKDIELFRQGWAGGNAFQEVYVDVKPGREPVIKTRNQNPFAIYWDPESRDLISREDAEFVDRITWMTFDDLIAQYPDKVTREDFTHANTSISNRGEVYQKTDIYKDRSHQSFDEKNGRIKVIERLYKCRRQVAYTLDNEYRRTDLKKGMRPMFGQEVFKEDQEYLHLAIACPAWNNGEYLYNDEYHCQPRDTGTGKIIFPILEFCAESLNGQPSGFVEHLIGPNKVVNSMMANILHASKHAASTSLIRRPDAFLNETESKLFDKHHSDGDRVFKAHPKAQDLDKLVTTIPKGEAARDNYQGMEIALNHFKEVSSTPPSIQGIAESSSTSGVLNAQRVEQAFVQLQVLIANWKQFLKRRSKLVYFYMKEYFSYEKTFRIIEKKDPQQPDFMTINQVVPQTDPMGNFTGVFEKINDITTLEYDISIEDNYRSPSYRYKTQQEISDLMQTTAVQSDPILMGMLFVEFCRLSDMSQETKDFVKQYSSAAQQQAMAAQQQQAQMGQMQMQQAELDQASQMQQIAQAEAEQTTAAKPPAPSTPVGSAFNYSRAKTSFSPQGAPA
jgi:hypothetical protein